MDLWDRAVDCIINSYKIRTNIIIIWNVCYDIQILKIFYSSYYIYHHKILCLVLAKKNVQKKNSEPDICKIYYNTTFIIMQLGNFYNYMRVLYNNVTYIFDYLF